MINTHQAPAGASAFARPENIKPGSFSTRQKDYLPFYHSMHESVKLLAEHAQANGSKTPAKVFHITYNRLINSAFGISSGSRTKITSQDRFFISSAQAIAARVLFKGIRSGIHHRELYQVVKAEILDFTSSIESLRLSSNIDTDGGRK